MKFKFCKQSDGLYHLTEIFETEKEHEFDHLEEVLVYGYFNKPFSYKNRIK